MVHLVAPELLWPQECYLFVKAAPSVVALGALTWSEHVINPLKSRGIAVDVFGHAWSPEAEPFAREALDGMRDMLGDHAPHTLVALSNLAQTLASLGNLEDAEPLMREDLQHSLRIHGPAHPDTLVSFNNLAQLLTLQNKHGEAEALEGRVGVGRDNASAPAVGGGGGGARGPRVV